MSNRLFVVMALAVAAISYVSAPAAAQATRTWVSGVGDDANPCSRTAPCKTFAGAISKTAASGIISVLDPGGFGAVTITKAISIQTDKGKGSILASGTNGIIVNAGPNDEIFLNGIIVDGAGTGINGIRFLGGKSLTLTDCIIRGFKGSPGVALDVSLSTGTASVQVSDCTLTGNNTGVSVAPTGTASPRVMLDHVLIERAIGGAGAVVASGSEAYVALSNTVMKSNSLGLVATGGGQIVSFGNNAFLFNGGAPTSTVPLE